MGLNSSYTRALVPVPQSNYTVLYSMLYILGLALLVLPAIGSDAGYSIECEARTSSWGEWSPVPGSRVMQERTGKTVQRRTDPEKNIAGRIMNSIRYPDVVKAAYLAKLKGRYCA